VEIGNSNRSDDSSGHRALAANQLVIEARQGSAAALDQLVEMLSGYLWAELGGWRKPRGLGPSHGLSDLVQDTLLRVREKFGRFQRDSFVDLKQWARTILHRRRQEWARNYRARNREELQRKIRMAFEARLLPKSYSGEHVDSLDRRDDVERALAAFNQLRPHEQTILKLRIVEGLSYPQIGVLTGLHAEGARTAYRRAIAHLKSLFDAHE